MGSLSRLLPPIAWLLLAYTLICIACGMLLLRGCELRHPVAARLLERRAPEPQKAPWHRPHILRSDASESSDPAAEAVDTRVAISPELSGVRPMWSIVSIVVALAGVVLLGIVLAGWVASHTSWGATKSGQAIADVAQIVEVKTANLSILAACDAVAGTLASLDYWFDGADAKTHIAALKAANAIYRTQVTAVATSPAAATVQVATPAIPVAVVASPSGQEVKS